MIWAPLILGLIATVAIHETAHILVARACGWTFRGFGISRTTVGVKVTAVEPSVVASAWLVALAGPMSNVVFGELLLALNNPITNAIAYCNFLVAVINLLPIPGSDGTVILKSLRGQIT